MWANTAAGRRGDRPGVAAVGTTGVSTEQLVLVNLKRVKKPF